MNKESGDKKFRPVFISALFVFMTITFFLSFATSSHAITITGTDEITTNSSASYSAADCNGTVSWGVTGTGASIGSNGGAGFLRRHNRNSTLF